MGNQISKCCDRTETVHSKNNEIELKTTKVKSKYPQKHAATKIQSVYRKFIAISKIKNLISSIQKDYFQNIGRNVDDDEIKNRRGKILSKIEEDFKEFHPEGLRMNKNFLENKNEKHNVFKKIFKTVYVNSTNEIFQGYFELNNLGEDKYVYQRNGYGCLYLYDGTKIEGIWSGDLIINDGIIFHNNGKIYIGEITKIYEEFHRGTTLECLEWLKIMKENREESQADNSATVRIFNFMIMLGYVEETIIIIK